jgi:hypothetical protein
MQESVLFIKVISRNFVSSFITDKSKTFSKQEALRVKVVIWFLVYLTHSEKLPLISSSALAHYPSANKSSVFLLSILRKRAAKYF